MAKFSFDDFLAAHDDLSGHIVDLGRFVVIDPSDAVSQKAVTAGLRYVCQMTGYLKAISYPSRIDISDEALADPAESIGEAVARARRAIETGDHGLAVDAIKVAVDACHNTSVRIYTSLPERTRASISAPPEHPFARFKDGAFQMSRATVKGDSFSPKEYISADRPPGNDTGGYRGRG